jgi:anti-sigma factor RsiW
VSRTEDGIGADILTPARTMRVTNYPVGWTCELIAVRIERYLVSALPRGEALAVAEHIEACVWCAERVAMRRLLGETTAASTHRPRTHRAPPGGAGARRRGGKRESGDHGR